MESPCGFYVYDGCLKLCLKTIFYQLQSNSARCLLPSPVSIQIRPNSRFCIFLSMLLSPSVLREVYLTSERTLRGHKNGGGPPQRKGDSTGTEVTHWSHGELCHSYLSPFLHLHLCISPGSPPMYFYFILSISRFQNVIHFLKGACSI